MRTLFIGLLILISAPCQAQLDAVELLIARADLIVVATCFKTNPSTRFGSLTETDEFEVVSVLAGHAAPKTVCVHSERSLLDKASPFTPGQRVVLFLKPSRPGREERELVDDILGYQNDSHTLEEAVTEVIRVSLEKTDIERNRKSQ